MADPKMSRSRSFIIDNDMPARKKARYRLNFVRPQTLMLETLTTSKIFDMKCRLETLLRHNGDELVVADCKREMRDVLRNIFQAKTNLPVRMMLHGYLYSLWTPRVRNSMFYTLTRYCLNEIHDLARHILTIDWTSKDEENFDNIWSFLSVMFYGNTCRIQKHLDDVKALRLEEIEDERKSRKELLVRLDSLVKQGRAFFNGESCDSSAEMKVVSEAMKSLPSEICCIVWSYA